MHSLFTAALKFELFSRVSSHDLTIGTRNRGAVLQLGLPEIRLRLRETAKPKDEAMKQSPKHRLGRDVRVLPAIAEARDRLPKLEDFVEIARERRQFVVLRCVHSYKWKILPTQTLQFSFTFRTVPCCSFGNPDAGAAGVRG
jgi:hypothetical protein